MSWDTIFGPEYAEAVREQRRKLKIETKNDVEWAFMTARRLLGQYDEETTDQTIRVAQVYLKHLRSNKFGVTKP